MWCIAKISVRKRAILYLEVLAISIIKQTMRNLFSFIDMDSNDQSVQDFVEEMYLKDPKYSCNAASEIDIKTPQDNSVNHHSTLLKIGFETVSDRVAIFSFNMGYDAEFKTLMLDDPILDLLEITSREELKSVLGAPFKSKAYFDQYLFNDKIVIGALSYPKDGDTITSYHFGSRKIFSDPKLIPNRFGFSLESVTLLERDE